ncbi:MAG: polysaccharide export outer membrane protein [Cyclobacteriaceae bacterium]|jgi:polysaccharide export outer membrane protein
MFQLDENFTPSELSRAVTETEKNYVIQKNDLVTVDVFTNKGERIVDPNFELQSTNGNQGVQGRQEFTYLVMENGSIKLPIVGDIPLDELTIYEAEEKLEQAYSGSYKEPFVKISFQNKRVILLGAAGGQVIPLQNENSTLAEVLAQAGGIDLGAKAHNIRLIRGELSNPEVYMIDLSTIEGLKGSIITIKPGDIIYVEPWRRVWLEGLKDMAPILSLVSSVLTLALVLQNLQ